MTLHKTIQTQRTEAMRARDEIRLNTLRGLLSAFTNENVAQKKKPDEPLSDEDALAVIAREAKKRRESILQFEQGGRNDLAERERQELRILEAFLPKQMNEDEIKKIVNAKKSELGVDSKADMGKLMAAVMAELKGRADGGVVKKIVEETLV